ncbi:RNase P subunit p30 family protein [Salinirubrum litoreum]|uniref:Ribonuclease P protein component 3 n=1 Tax=Salinirubrum litoreum TaxID=1126234 RepID=A0ABD5R685_9EURY
MYEAVAPYPEGESTASRYALTASEYGFDGVVCRRTRPTDAPESEPATADIRSEFGVDVVDAVEIDADDPQSASGSVGNYRPKTTLLCVRGGTDAVNRYAVEAERVDVLTRPFADGGDVNHVLAKAAATNGVRIAFELGPVLRSDGGRRVQHLKKLRKLRELVRQYDTPFVVTGSPRSHLELRAPRELRAVGETIGFDPEEIESGLAEWGRLADRNRERASEEFIAPGVKRGKHEEDT